ncbi:MAG: hypothetical protein IKS66_03465 [Oscillospiraceae bacterium]|nr:hypothetical protein [Oscillospiraceae bacterium]
MLLLLLLITPLGLDLSYYEGVFALKLRVGFLRLTLAPRKPQAEGKPKKKKKKKKKPAPAGESAATPRRSRFPQLGLADIFELLDIVFRLLGRLRRYLSIDELTLHLVTGASDPFDAVLLFGRLNAGLGALAPVFHSVFRVRNEDIRLGADVTPGASMAVEGRLAFTWQLWELLHTVNCAGLGLLKWYLPKRRAQKRSAAHSPAALTTGEQKG